MRRDLIAIICCPVHKTGLELKARKSAPNGDVLEGHLRCPTCDFDYPIEEGIPNLLPPEYHVDEVKAATPKPTAPGAKTGKKATK